MYIDSESELRKIGSQAKKIVLKDFAGKFGALFFIWFGYKIDAPISYKKWNIVDFVYVEHCQFRHKLSGRP